MNYYFIKEILTSDKDDRNQIFEAIDYMNDEWYKFANKNDNNNPTRDWFHVQHCILNGVCGAKELTKYIIVYTGLSYICNLDLEIYEEKEIAKRILKALNGTFSEIDSEVRKFEEYYNHLLN